MDLQFKQGTYSNFSNLATHIVGFENQIYRSEIHFSAFTLKFVAFLIVKFRPLAL